MNKIKLLPQYKPLFRKHSRFRYYIVTGGRGGAKSFHVSLALLNYLSLIGQTALFTRYTMSSANKSIIPEFREKIEMLNVGADYKVKRSEIQSKATGSRLMFSGIKTSSGDQTAKLKSIAGLNIFIVDEAEELTDYDTFNTIDDSVRKKGVANRIIVVMNPTYKSHWVYQKFISQKRDDTCLIHVNYLSNLHNLDQSFIDKANRVKETNPTRYKHVYLGEWLESGEGLLWMMSLIDSLRTPEIPDLKKKVVAIDPAITSNENSDETGIIVCGIDNEGFGYMLDDFSGVYSPAKWAKQAVFAKKKWNADYYVAESNQGGDMVENILKQQDPTGRVKLVRATKGKYLRAEPIYSLYEDRMIFHYGKFDLLENQMVNFNPLEKNQSPDRLDALVWGFTDLMLDRKDIIVV